MKATTVFTNGTVYTGTGSTPLSYLAIDRGAVMATGRGSAKKFIGRKTTVIDLKGKCITPGITDSHIHLLDYAWSLSRVDLSDCANEEAVRSKLRERAATVVPGEWILGRSWNKEQFHGFPHRKILDEIFPQNPVALNSHDGHFLWVNSRGLAIAGLSRQVFVSGGFVGTDPDGSLTGILGENAVQLVTPMIAKPEKESRKNSLLAAQQKLHSFGIVALHSVDGNQAFGDLQELHRESRLKLRIFHAIPADQLQHAITVGMKTGLGDAWFRFGFVKIFSDGTLGSQSAWMLEPFDGTSEMGIETIAEQELSEKVGQALQNGIAVGVHAIGDRANRQVLNAFEKNQQYLGIPSAPSRIEHAQLLHPKDIPRFRKIGIVASMQPYHAVSDYELVQRYWNGRQEYAYPWRSLLDHGTSLVFGSDAPIENPDPLQGLQAAVHRGSWSNRHQVVNALQALLSYTRVPAMASGEADHRGTLEPGKLADFVIFSEDPILTGFREARVLGTAIEGEFVYRDFQED